MNTNLPKHILELEDLRQSNEWAQFLSWVGWKKTQITNGTQIYLMPFLNGNINKIQRPKILNEIDLKEIEDVCKKNKCLLIKIEPNMSQDIEVLKKMGYKKSLFPLLAPTTICIDLTKSKEELWENISHSGKYSINRAEREGYTVEFYRKPNLKILEQLHKVTEETSEKKRFLKVGLQDLQKKVEIFQDNSFVILAKDKSGQIVCANFYLAHKTGIWYLHGGTTNIGRKSKAGYKLVWESFAYFKELGFKVLDLEGKDDKRFPNFTKNWGGFSHFKEKFGGYIVEYPGPMVKPLNPVLKVLQKIYGTLPI